MKCVRFLAPAGWAGVLLGVFLAIPGCVSAPPRSDQEIVAEKAQKRWNALVAGDFKAAYEMISPAGRSIVTQEGWSGTLKRGFWKDARVTEVTCASPELCEVRLEIEYDYRGRRTRTPFEEKWVKQDSAWWFLLQ